MGPLSASRTPLTLLQQPIWRRRIVIFAIFVASPYVLVAMAAKCIFDAIYVGNARLKRFVPLDALVRF